MARDPRPGDADLLGRPVPALRDPLVDSTCFPSVPGGTITFPSMANAYRIATAAAREDARVIGVTGANGYVGGRILARLRASGVEAVALVRRPAAGERAGAPLRARGAARSRGLDGIEVVVHAAYDLSEAGRGGPGASTSPAACRCSTASPSGRARRADLLARPRSTARARTTGAPSSSSSARCSPRRRRGAPRTRLRRARGRAVRRRSPRDSRAAARADGGRRLRSGCSSPTTSSCASSWPHSPPAASTAVARCSRRTRYRPRCARSRWRSQRRRDGLRVTCRPGSARVRRAARRRAAADIHAVPQRQPALAR